jgi:hypothetical protein
MEIDKEFLDTVQYDIAPIVNECYKSKFGFKNIKLHEVLNSLVKNNIIISYSINNHGTYLYIISSIYLKEIEKHHYYSCVFIEIDDQYIIFDVNKVHIGYNTPNESGTIFIEVPKTNHTSSNVREESQ